MGESIILRSCYVESLKLAVKHGCRSVAFPLISSGVYQYPKDQVLKFAIQTITEFLFEHELTVYICVFDRESYSFSQKLFNDIKSFIDDDYVEDHDEDFYFEHDAPAKGLLFNKLSEAALPMFASEELPGRSARGKTLKEYMKQMDRSFAEMLFDLIDESAHVFDANGRHSVEIIPEESKEAVEKYRDMLMEAVAATDEDLMMKYFEGEEITFMEAINAVH